MTETRTPAELVAKWRERASQYERGVSTASEFGRCETYANCADQLEAALRQAEPPSEPHPYAGVSLHDAVKTVHAHAWMELQTPADIWPDHVRDMIAWLEQGLITHAGNRPQEGE